MDLSAKLASIHQRIGEACGRVGRDPASVTLLAVSKGQPAEVVRQAIDAGQLFFGESKVQEAKVKIPLCSGSARWHLIGHLQSNKAREAVHWFEMIHGVDSFKLAEELNKCADKAAKSTRVLLEVNVSGESSKFGFQPDQLVSEFMRINSLPRVEIHGLMTIAPWSPSTERSRSTFRALAQLKVQCEQQIGAPLPVLSMGMSDDFEVAIEEGATVVRVGTALFGPRSYARRSISTTDGLEVPSSE